MYFLKDLLFQLTDTTESVEFSLFIEGRHELTILEITLFRCVQTGPKIDGSAL